ncbi:glutamyl-tRNA reductase [Aneurinibacillus migulanus]|uniref:Glutamyl-tRNA reductase n=1 Tax=Aneurinibacillus migulanus TaxID=47500 RepID=A0A0D1W2Z6_ANEMI|nr:glutamyl-tRNA reductase [Aneurinibacillus migulanus]KIV52795.1 glutamyl-tRNA reductase [Aneurinibacillus migulanus]KIV59149.1 glutamyl-tRNA reductase [Aneurinibacillus migulanus]KON95065.1 glutamyl-tRNA reductase [Aneurinibacillus migulanus]KPD09295.1 glutamyl-tRNA reductase [Aneurinibacillus migulanus]MED0895499.1 glutamyl-tRNA reductase [Aneurinibacillus migulanus]
MHILTIGLNYRTAPVEIRERFAFLEQDKPEALAKLQNTKSILECVIVGTCNRTEIYAVVDQLHTGRHFTKNYLSEWFGVPREEFIDHIYIKENDTAVQHLFRVACGLDSMVLGETQILGQIKDAFALSQSQGATGTVFNKLFQQTITLAKRAHSETEINKNAVSTSYAAIELGKKVFGYFDNKTVLVLGAGKMSELTAKHLHANGAPRVLVANRTYERAVSLAEKFRGIAMPMDQLQDALVLADIVISSTGSDDYVVTKRDVETIMRKRRQRPLFMIDIAVPRDLDPAINDLDGVYLYDIDDLEGIVAANMRERAREAEKIGIMIGEELVAFKTWLNTLGVGPLISALREKLLTHQQEAMRNIENKCPELTEKEIRMINKQTRSLINQIMHDPIVRIKEMSGQPGADEALDMFIKLFALENSFEEAEQEVEEKEASYIPVRHRRVLTEQQAF